MGERRHRRPEPAERPLVSCACTAWVDGFGGAGEREGSHLSGLSTFSPPSWISGGSSSGEAASTELLASAPGYSAEAQRVGPYNEDLVSWPDLSEQPVEVADLSGGAERECSSGWRRAALNGESSASASRSAPAPQRPYVDPILANGPRAHAGFGGETRQGSVISFRVARAADPYSLGCCFVEKVGEGALRLVFDARVANEGSAAPPETALPAARAFYRALVTEGMEELFAPHAISHRMLNIKQIDGRPVSPDCVLQPMTRVSPMGWSWLLLFCRGILRRALVRSGFGDGGLVEDGRPSPALLARGSAAAAGNAGNLAIVGGDAETVAARRGEVTRMLEVWELLVRSIRVASSVSAFTGLEINGGLGAAG
ncbi:unnamed protein product, partial [Prorocentrum cordatum]